MSTVENKSPKQEMLAILNDQPDDSTFDQLLRELASRRAIRSGLMDVEKGKVVSNEEAMQRIKSWQS